MIVDKNIANFIISELKPVVSFDINLIGNDGIIISSTDKKREGTLHYGAVELAEHNRSELIIYKDDEYKGCKKGINLPVIVNNERVAIVGITGEPNEVIKQGTLVRKMTEVLIQYDISKILKYRQESITLLLVNDLINGNIGSSPEAIEHRITQSGLKCSGPFSVALLRLKKTNDSIEDDSDIILLNMIKEQILRTFNANHIICSYNEHAFVIIANLESSKLYDLLVSLQQEMEERTDYRMICSIGSERSDYRDIERVYNEALLLNAYLPDNESGVYMFSAAALSVLIDQIPADSKAFLFDNVFKKCSDVEIDQFCDFIMTYFNCNGSITKISELTYQHKNTVQYKIAKIKNKTELDIRISHDLFVLYIAALYARNR